MEPYDDSLILSQSVSRNRPKDPKNGGELNISNNGEIRIGLNRSFKVDEGGKCTIASGKIQ